MEPWMQTNKKQLSMKYYKEVATMMTIPKRVLKKPNKEAYTKRCLKQVQSTLTPKNETNQKGHAYGNLHN